MFQFAIHAREQFPYVSFNAPLCACRVKYCGNAPPCYTYFNMREQCSLMLHGQSQARAFLFTKERHLHIQFKRPLGGNMMEEEKERRKKKGKTGFNQVFSQSKVD